MTCEIIKGKTCVLTPFELGKMREQLNPTYQAIFDVLLHSQMRIEEFWWFVDHPETYTARRRCINLPSDAIKKTETIYDQRDVILSIKGCEAVEHLIRMKLNVKKDKMTRQAMGDAFKRAADKAIIGEKDGVPIYLGSKFICPKMLRKSAISFLVAIFPEKREWINSSAGHTSNIQLRHYLGTSFTNGDKEEMKVIFRGWGEA